MIKFVTFPTSVLERLRQNLNLSGQKRFSTLLLLRRSSHKFYMANSENPKVSNMDITDNDIQLLFKSLNKHRVKYLVVGGFATTFYGYIRVTNDLDLWIKPGENNKKNLITALTEINVEGANHLLDMPLVAGYTQVTIGDSGFVLDLMNNLKKFKDHDFDKCYARAKRGKLEGTVIYVINLEDLIKEKKATGRHKDKDDVENLNQVKKINKKP